MSANQQIVYYVSCLTCLLFWSICYLLLIRRAFKDRVYGMPLIPLCVNISYEFIFGILHPDKPPMNYVNIVWFFIDVVIAYQYLRFGNRSSPPTCRRHGSHPLFCWRWPRLSRAC